MIKQEVKQITFEGTEAKNIRKVGHISRGINKEEYMKQWRNEHKEELQEYWKKYREEHKEEARIYGRAYYHGHLREESQRSKRRYYKFQKEWRGIYPSGIPKKVSEKAEKIGEDILKLEGFYDITTMNKKAIFDYYARKNGKIYGIDVTTSIRKPLRKQHKEMARFFNLIICILVIKPDFTLYKLIETPACAYQAMNVHNLRDFKRIPEEITND